MSQSDGAHNEVFNVIDQMPARTVKDYENIIARLRALPVYIDQTIALMREQLAAGLAQPAIVVDLTLDQLPRRASRRQRTRRCSPRFAASRPRSPPPIRSVCARRLARRTSSSSCQLEAARDVPPRHLSEAGAAADGVELAAERRAPRYAALIHAYTTTRMTPEQIHQLGLQEVARIEKEMERLARAAGFSGPVTDFEKQLGAATRHAVLHRRRR